LTTTNTYNAFGDLTASSQQLGAGQTLDHTYDYDRRSLLEQTVWDPTGVNAVASTVYDAFAGKADERREQQRAHPELRHLGRVVTDHLDPGAGHLAIGTSTTYDAFDRVLTQPRRLNNVTTFSYDKTNRTVTMLTPELISVTTAQQPPRPDAVDHRRPGQHHQYDYDQDGNLRQMSRTNVRDKSSPARSTPTTRPTGSRRAGRGRQRRALQLRRHQPRAHTRRRLGDLNLTTTYEYNARGLATKVTDARNMVTQTEFDAAGAPHE